MLTTMKAEAGALPKAIEARVTRVARRLRKPRGVVLREAIEEYAARHEPEAVTEAMNRLAAVLDIRLDPGVAGASRRILERTEW
jgi:predicted DNA-binding protein